MLVDLPTTGEVTDFEDFTGRTVATRNVDIRARVTGYVDKINFRELEGHDVEKGFVLYEIDPRPYEAEVARAKANLLQATVARQAARSGLSAGPNGWSKARP